MLVWHAQERPSSCVAACVRIVLAGLNKSLTEARVRHVLGSSRLGITLKAAQERLAQAGVQAVLQTDWSLDDVRDSLARGRYPIVGIERQPLGYAPASHAVVIIRMTSKRISVLDPLDGPHPKREGFPLHVLLAGLVQPWPWYARGLCFRAQACDLTHAPLKRARTPRSLGFCLGHCE